MKLLKKFKTIAKIGLLSTLVTAFSIGGLGISTYASVSDYGDVPFRPTPDTSLFEGYQGFQAFDEMDNPYINLNLFNVQVVEFTDEMRALVQETMDLLAAHGIVEPSGRFAYGSSQLRLTTTMNIADGLSPNQILQMNTIGLAAQNAAAARYPNNEMREDAFRHFTWSFRLAGSIGWNNARIATNNHEFSGRIINNGTWQRFHDEELRNAPWWVHTAPGGVLGWARDMADARSITERTRMANEAQASNAAFRRVFTNDDIMDFYNNWAGFSFAGVTNNATTAQNAFYTAERNGIIVIDNSNTQVSDFRVTDLRNSGQWRHFQ